MTTIERTTAREVVESQHGYISDKKRHLDRLKRIEGQGRGIHQMVEEEQYCIDILTQISALTSALRGVALGLLDDHLKHCVADRPARRTPQRRQDQRSLPGHRPPGPLLTTIKTPD
jgi:CsoR family transcriptional regulator, copper-sensing transcriptional repressor